MTVNILLCEEPSKNEVDRLNDLLLEYNQSKIRGYSHNHFMIRLEDELNEMIGGIHCLVSGGWLYIDSLWVNESLRNKGFGKKLVLLAEEEAIKRACIGVYLYTYSFQNPEF